ncbi:MAG TPA: helix-turn-helix domain-containing protein [Methylomirabilota bacterium]|jgi:DNA-binding HxlR family transcriptional regulator|nr:helix-turn-helix domain-containing protein [Methylomirabilota bacterium]
MHGYGQFCPVAVACEVFAERWTPLIVRELFAGSRRFSEIRRGMPLISRALLTQRLRHLEDVGVIESRPVGRGREYRLSQAGAEFHGIIEGLGAWGQRWVHGRASAENLDASLLLWNLRRRLAVDQLPDRRVVVRFDFRGVPAGRGPTTAWLVVTRKDVDVCLKDPGHGVDLVVAADLGTFTRVWLGDVSFDQAVRSRRISLEGPRELVRAFPGWLLLSHYAGVARPRPARAS